MAIFFINEARFIEMSFVVEAETPDEALVKFKVGQSDIYEGTTTHDSLIGYRVTSSTEPNEILINTTGE